MIGMAHRGRLNVLVNTLGKAPSMLFEEFEGKKPQDLSSGDVKYHLGYSSSVSTPGGPCQLTLAFNPSHLEIVNPVVAGSVYSRQHRRGEGAQDKVLPVLIHGDAAVAGQGVNQEMLNFGQTRGFGTGGTVHIVVNNQIGFTTSDPRDLRSTIYCTDIFKMVDAPIFHVNGDDPEAVALVTRLALEYRMEFKKDVVVDLVCFRKLGHNEQDEPMVTQPLMYKRVAQHPGTRRRYADKLVAEGILTADGPDDMIRDYREHLDRGELLYNPVIAGYTNPLLIDWTPFLPPRYIDNCDTTVPVRELKRLCERLTAIPDNIALHSRVKKIIDDRRQMGQGSLPFDWGMAENLAYATLLVSGHGVRLTGEDVCRGTFFHRHAVIHDQNREVRGAGSYCPLENLQQKQAEFQCYDSVLSEEAVLAFEYGYATSNPFDLVIWEAQFGDFANCAQVVIDQFIASGEAKWGKACGLTLFLPHGYEGQGPEHSSARIERFMQLCAEANMEVCQPTTPAQVFHMLRRQAIPQAAQAAHRVHAEIHAAPQGSRLLAGRTGQGQLPARDRRGRSARSAEGHPRAAMLGQGLLRTRRGAPQAQHPAHRDRPPGTDLSVPAGSVRSRTGALSARRRNRLVPGRPAQPGRLVLDRLAPAPVPLAGQDPATAARLAPASASPAVGYLSKHNAQQKALIDSALGEIGPYKPA